ncbi:hypothetical protein AGMMS50293_30450 [Spirochaetia bacterium]|nr:hypothetical protein AGMMS50293_30450 [Spirochaetia bacterium]
METKKNDGIPFSAYQGDDPYIFISYGHADTDRVFPIISEFHNEGLSVWYDEGIDPGNEWPEEIGTALEKCALFIVFISDASAASENVRNEINLALGEKKPFIAIWLEETKLTSGLKLQIGSKQAIPRYKMNNKAFYYKCYKSFDAFGITKSKEASPHSASGNPAIGGNGKLFVSGSDIYVAGSEKVGEKLKAAYWKNGKTVRLSSSFSTANSIFVSDAPPATALFSIFRVKPGKRSDVYVAGTEDHKACYWKNGVAVCLFNTYSEAYSIFVSGSDVYVAGYETVDLIYTIATYWKNGAAVHLSNSHSNAYSIFVSGSNIYIAGTEDGKATYWKNGAAVRLSNISSYTSSIFVSGSNIYIAGTEDGKATYWKNGAAVRLSNISSYTSSITRNICRNALYSLVRYSSKHL